jgi:3-deoxy-D-manno-octulosonic-acid transferase
LKLIYRYLLYPLLILGFKILAFLDKKINVGLIARKSKPWKQAPFKSDRWFWFHVSSGEFEYAKPVIKALKNKIDCKVVVTYFSPSVEKSLSQSKDVDYFLPTPWDRPSEWQAFLKAFNPRCLAIARTDAWPEMVWQSKKYGTPIVLFSATLPDHSPRVKSFWGRMFYGSYMKHIDEILCVSLKDQLEFGRYNPRGQVQTFGDTRYDQVLSRLEERRPTPFLNSIDREKTIIYGSTWEEDELQLLAAFKCARDLGFNNIIVPHEPSAEHISKLQTRLRDHGLQSELLSQVTHWQGGTLIVDSVGVLADLYPKAFASFVGGSFKKSIHSVMESAAAGCFTFFGPYYHNNREAERLIEEGLALSVRDSASLVQLIHKLSRLSQDEKSAQSDKISNFIKTQKGVSLKVAQIILQHSKNS